MEQIAYNFDQPAFIDLLISRRKYQRIKLIKANRKYLRAQELYRKRYHAFNELKEPFQAIDREICMIQHQERLAKEKAAKRAAKAATPKQKKEAKTAIEKMLAELPDELRASIIANFAKN